MLGTPEKALLDLFHLQTGAWTHARVREMRFQQQDLIAPDRLMEYAGRFARPRVKMAAELWLEMAKEELAEGIDL